MLTGALLGAAPRVVPVRDHPLAFWADASGFERRGGDPATAQALLAAAREGGFAEARVAIAGTCIAAAAATRERGSAWRVVPPGRDASFLSRRPLEVLPMEDELRRTLRLLGLRSCGELARIAAAEVELRFGAEGVRVWRLARGEDLRWPFRPPPPEHASAEAEFEPPVATLEPLRFVLRGLIASVVVQMACRQRLPAALRLLLRLEGAPEVSREIRPARPTADERVLADLCRLALEGIGELAASIVGIFLEELETGAARADQLDIFRPAAPDPAAVHTALAPLLARWGEGALSRAVLHGAHLPAAHASWEALGERGIRELTREEQFSAGSWRSTQACIGPHVGPAVPRASAALHISSAELPLCLRRFPEPQGIRVTVDAQGRPVGLGSSGAVIAPLEDDDDLPDAVPSGGRPLFVAGSFIGPAVPAQFSDAWQRLHAEGPERISGEWWGSAYAREYWLAEDEYGRLWLLFRDGRTGEWWGEGWWD
ncbi:MAG TPA: hypothetical protein VGR27_08965 [Longimicrobiaceae bacterium]|nr:hypothetical protein [Longimicrobiaceae bacterium]